MLVVTLAARREVARSLLALPSNRRLLMFRAVGLALHTLRVAVYVRIAAVKSYFANS